MSEYDACRYCGREYKAQGLATHEMWCRCSGCIHNSLAGCEVGHWDRVAPGRIRGAPPEVCHEWAWIDESGEEPRLVSWEQTKED